uniref:NAD(P)(+)--arginine ADP-ribosyltransferase n=1 Tax=Oryzias latipes TaxID=8090 RepID=A0A3P9JTA2_ORYLA
MADNSVDDMYEGCEDKMYQKVEKEFLENEKNKNEKFRAAWNEAEMTTSLTTILSRPELVAIYVYTNALTKIYSDLNKEVRELGTKYKTGFNFHSLHYFLTSALKKLDKKKEGKCYTAYRRTTASFSQDVLNKEIRFGYFTSSSQYPLESSQSKELEKDFGNKSCFVIETCFGADISPYSKFRDEEAEILIPPYEVFEVTNIETIAKKKELPCEVVYTLKSTKKPFSNYNCALFKSSMASCVGHILL